MENDSEEKTGPVEALNRFVASSRRVLTIAHKPDNETFKTMLKIIAIGIIIIGLIGFGVQWLFALTGLGR